MKVFVLFGQRKCAYPGEYAPEALDCISEYGNDDNPDFLIEQKEMYEKSGEFDSLAVVQIGLADGAIDKALFPERTLVEGTVEDSD